MAGDKTTLSASESLRSTRTYGKVRCHNPSCMGRLQPEPGSEHVKCPTCGMEYRIFWVNPQLPRIRGPEWETNRKLAEQKMAEWEANQKLAEQKTNELDTQISEKNKKKGGK
jgi:hypothetical protein